MKNVLIIGANSFVGNAVAQWLTSKHENEYSVDIVDAIDDKWMTADFSKYDVVYQVAGIAHVLHETEEMRNLFFSVNAELTERIAKHAKECGVKQYIFMSTKAVYASFVPVIDENTPTNPPKLYGASKLDGENRLLKLKDDNFHVSLLRVPSIYGKNAAGSYYKLFKKVDKMWIFPAFRNERSLIYIDNFCEFIHLVISRELYGILVPQDANYVSTSDIVRVAAKVKGKKILFDYISWPFIWIGIRCSKKIKKAFGSTVFKHNYSINDMDYYVTNFEEAIKKTFED